MRIKGTHVTDSNRSSKYTQKYTFISILILSFFRNVYDIESFSPTTPLTTIHLSRITTPSPPQPR